MSKCDIVRGAGPLDNFIANLRHAKAISLMGPNKEGDRAILDMGCGAYPYFLEKVAFSRKYGVDQLADEHSQHKDIIMHRFDLGSGESLPFEDETFDAVTILAVIEHIRPENVEQLLISIRRLLKPEGVLVITTPAPWSDWLLRTMAAVKVVSSEEIEDHKAVYSRATLIERLGSAGFNKEGIRAGYFEMFLNVWAVAVK